MKSDLEAPPTLIISAASSSVSVSPSIAMTCFNLGAVIFPLFSVSIKSNASPKAAPQTAFCENMLFANKLKFIMRAFGSPVNSEIIASISSSVNVCPNWL